MKYVDVWITKTVCNKKYSSSLQVCTNSHSMLWWVSPNLSLSLKHWQQHKRQCTKPSRLESTYPALIIRLRPEEYISSRVSAQRKAVLSLNTVTLNIQWIWCGNCLTSLSPLAFWGFTTVLLPFKRLSDYMFYIGITLTLSFLAI